MVTSAACVSLCPPATQGAVELLASHGSTVQKRTYLTKLVSGAWSGTMNLTEPQAGSDVGALRARAVKGGLNSTGSPAEDIHHLRRHDMPRHRAHVLRAHARTRRRASGHLAFIVPKFPGRPDGTLADRNDLAASRWSTSSHPRQPTASWPTATTVAPSAELVGEENRGIEYMFTMMNTARLSAASRAGHRRARLSAGPRLCENADPGSRRRRRTLRRPCRSSGIPT